MEEEILNKRWKDVDKLLLKYNKDYKKLNRKTQDRLQDVFNMIDIPYQDINKPISKQEKARLDRFILEMQKDGLLSDYFGYKARLILNKKKVAYSKMLEIMIEGCYIKENKELDEINNLLYYEIADNSYRQGIKEANILDPIYLHIPFETMYLLLNIPLLEATAEAYLKAIELNNADELYKRALMILQQGKAIDVDSKELQELLMKQRNRIINIKKEGQPTGAISNITDNLVNEAYLQVAKDNNIQKVRFVAINDSRTTKMCRGMNNMLFNVNDWNRFFRYSAADGRDVYYVVKGLVAGINLPPITNHFHYCRSTITYMFDDEEVAEYVRGNIKVSNGYDKEQYSRYKRYYGDEIPDDVETFTKMKYNNKEKWEYYKRNYNDRKLRYKIRNEYNLTINPDKNNKHIEGTKEYFAYIKKNPNASILTIDSEKEQSIIDDYAGFGMKKRKKNGEFENKEVITTDEIIGYVYDINGEKVYTKKGTIHYSKTGTHLVPTLKE